MANPISSGNRPTSDGPISDGARRSEWTDRTSEDGVDRALVARAQSGDVAAFGDLVDRHSRAVYGIVSRMTASRDDADDIVQDVFVSAYRAIGGFRCDARFSTWIHAIAVNTTLKRLKMMKRRNCLSIDDPDTGLGETLMAEGDPSPLGALQDGEMKESIRGAIDRLPDKQRIVVVLHYFEDYTCEQIAGMLECSVGTVWSRLHYACKKLKNELEWLQQVS